MFSDITKPVRSNQNAIMYRIGTGTTAFYTIYDLRESTTTYQGTLNACKKAWNRHYANSRQFVAMGNHRYMF